MSIVDALKKLGKKLNTGGTEPTGESIADVLESIESAFNITGAAGQDGQDGDDGEDGASVTAIELEVTDGVVSGGTATLSDGNTVNITVTVVTDDQQGG